jgi:hypothetical protein
MPATRGLLLATLIAQYNFLIHHFTCILFNVALIYEHSYHPVTMHLFLATTLLPFAYAKTSGQLCSGTAEFSNGNWYCSEIRAITYRNISQPGAYNQTTFVNPDTGLCGHERLNYPATGPLTPLFGEVTLSPAGVQMRSLTWCRCPCTCVGP